MNVFTIIVCIYILCSIYYIYKNNPEKIKKKYKEYRVTMYKSLMVIKKVLDNNMVDFTEIISVLSKVFIHNGPDKSLLFKEIIGNIEYIKNKYKNDEDIVKRCEILLVFLTDMDKEEKKKKNAVIKELTKLREVSNHTDYYVLKNILNKILSDMEDQQ